MEKLNLFQKFCLLFYFILFALILSIGVILYTMQSSFCNTCHEMRKDYQAWESSSHQEINCVSCHIEPGVLNLLIHKLATLKELYNHFRGFEEPINKNSELSKKLPENNCLNCHSLVKVTPREGMIINHDAHKGKLTCAYCHNRVGHPGMDGYYNRMKMSECMKCHDGKKAPRECNVCHTSEFKITPKSHDILDWRRKHGKKAKKDDKPCLFCHYEKKDCLACHGMEMPHISNWIRLHQREKRLFGLCKKCHPDPYYCEKCHHPGYDPKRESWRSVHRRTVGRIGNSHCLLCHKSSYCLSCHGRR